MVDSCNKMEFSTKMLVDIMTEQELIDTIGDNIKDQGRARVSAMEVFNLFETRLKASWEFTDAVVAFAQDHDWSVYPIGEVPFGELMFYPARKDGPSAE